LERRAQDEPFPLTPERVRTEFLIQYGDTLKHTPTWARRKLHEGKWFWDPKKPLSEYNLTIRELFAYAGPMAVADQTTWYLQGLIRSPPLLKECQLDERGEPWQSLEDLIKHAIKKDMAWRNSRPANAHAGVENRGATPLRGPRVAAAAPHKQVKRPRSEPDDHNRRQQQRVSVQELRKQMCKDTFLCINCHRPNKDGHKTGVKTDPNTGRTTPWCNEPHFTKANPKCACAVCTKYPLKDN
jgi:hypothetical protein